MEYKGYVGRVEFDQEAGVLFGEVEGIRDVVTFEATSVEELQQAFERSIDDYLRMCAERGETPERPYSGRYVVRVDPNLHRSAALAAARRGISLNALTSTALEQLLNSEHGRRAVRERPAQPPARSAGEPTEAIPTYETTNFAKQMGLFSISGPADTGPTNTGPATPTKHAA